MEDFFPAKPVEGNNKQFVFRVERTDRFLRIAYGYAYGNQHQANNQTTHILVLPKKHTNLPAKSSRQNKYAVKDLRMYFCLNFPFHKKHKLIQDVSLIFKKRAEY